MIKIITNNKGSGDWIVIKNDDQIINECHRITASDLQDILNNLGHQTDLVSLTDTEMEEGTY